ncbi:MAG: hypothetical protein GY758_19115 [Fuerstiella sp.]|nr:hypothetical protein [Fuerstiella sp.]
MVHIRSGGGATLQVDREAIDFYVTATNVRSRETARLKLSSVGDRGHLVFPDEEDRILALQKLHPSGEEPLVCEPGHARGDLLTLRRARRLAIGNATMQHSNRAICPDLISAQFVTFTFGGLCCQPETDVHGITPESEN